MPQKEAALRRRITKKLQETEGGFWFHPFGSPYQPSGLPDIIGCWRGGRKRGIFVGFEVKVPGGSGLTQKQAYTLDRIKAAGGVAAMIRSFDDAKTVLDKARVAPASAGDKPRRKP